MGKNCPVSKNSKKTSAVSSSSKDKDDLPHKFPENVDELDKLLIGVPEEKRILIRSAFALHVSSWEGPLPSPERMAQFDAIIPHGAERNMANFEEESTHRREIEKKVIGAQIFESRLGQVFAFLIAVIGFGSAIYLGMNDHDWLAGTCIVGSLGSLVAAFIQGKIHQNKDLSKKSA